MNVLVLRTSNHLHQSHKGFQHPKEIGKFVEAPDWNPNPVCGGGIHGWLWGEGNGNLGNWEEDDVWQVYSVKPENLVELGNNVKFRRGKLVCVGDRKTATDYVLKRAPGKAVVGAFAITGNYGTVTVGDHGMATAGDFGTAIAGDFGITTAGYGGTAIAGDYGTATTNDNGTARVGIRGTATAGDEGVAMTGDYGMAITGDHGTATASFKGTATAGMGGTVTAGDFGTAMVSICGTASAGSNGIIRIAYAITRLRWKIGYIGEDGLEPNVKYALDSNNNFYKI